MGDSRSVIRRRYRALAALLLCLGAAGGALLRARLEPPAAGGPGGAPPEAGVLVSLSARAAALWARLVGALSPEGGHRFTYERLAKLLAAHRKDPVARAFAVDFARDAELRKIWVEFFESRGKLDGAWLARRLGKSKGFAQLLNRYAEDLRFRKLAEAFTRGLAGEVQGRLAAVLGARELLESSSARVANPFGSRAGLRAVGEARAARSPMGGPATEAARGSEGDLGQRGAAELGGDREGKALRLTAVREAGPSQALSAWASICYKSGSGISREQCAAINEHLGEDALWNACLKAGQLDKCVSLCRGNLELGCRSQAEELDDCRSSHSAAACADACGRGDCRAAAPQPAGSEELARADGLKPNETEKECAGEDCERPAEPKPVTDPRTDPEGARDGNATSPDPPSGEGAAPPEPAPEPEATPSSDSRTASVPAPGPREQPRGGRGSLLDEIIDWVEDAARAVRSFFRGLGR